MSVDPTPFPPRGGCGRGRRDAIEYYLEELELDIRTAFRRTYGSLEQLELANDKFIEMLNDATVPS
jgi:hypothetical protein